MGILDRGWFAPIQKTEVEMRIPFALALLAITLAGCAEELPDLPSVAAADPAAPVPKTVYKPVTAGTEKLKPAEPLPWGESNKKVAPSEASQ